MSEKFYIGRDVTEFTDNGDRRPISRVTLMLDDETCYTAGDDTGAEFVANCVFATQEMANKTLAAVKGYVHKAFNAEAANIDPSAELGDGVTVMGKYSIYSEIDDDGHGYPNILAAGEKIIEEEYGGGSPLVKSFNRKIAKAKASLRVDVDAITAKIEGEGGLEDQFTELKVTLDGVTVTDSSGTTKIKGSSIETESLNLSGSISFEDLSSDVANDINDSWAMAQSAMITASGTESKLASLTYTYGGKTYIDGTQILTGTVTASTLQGGSIYLLNNSAQTKGIITLADAYTTGYAVELESVNGALRLLAGSGSVYIQAGGLTGSYVMLDGADVSIGYANLRPGYANDATCGTATYPWSDIYAVNSTIQTSDRNKKNSINYDLTPYDQFFDSLKPASFKFDEGTSGRTHIGMIAQDVEESLAECALTTKEFAGYVAFYDEELREKGYALRYGEFIALCIEQIQRLKARVAILEDRI